MFKNIFTPHVTLKRHQFVLENVTCQLHLLSNWTRYAFGELNSQVQQASEVTLQNREALDMMLLKEHGGYGTLTVTGGECCVTMHKATTSTEEAGAMEEIPGQKGELFQSMQPSDWFDGGTPGSWLQSILRSLGLRGWGAWLTKTGLMLVAGFVFLMMGIAVVHCMITCAISSFSSLFSPSICYVRITALEDDLSKDSTKTSEPRGGVEPQVGVSNPS